MSASGIEPDGAWSPAFPGQRAPFPAGHTHSLVSGAWSPRHVEPLARELVELVRADPTTSYLATSPAYGVTVWSWATAQARAELLSAWLSEQPIEAQLRPPRGGAKAPVEVWRQLLTTAANLADKLGLTPLSRARLGKDSAIGQAVADEALRRVAAEGRKEIEQAQRTGLLRRGGETA